MTQTRRRGPSPTLPTTTRHSANSHSNNSYRGTTTSGNIRVLHVLAVFVIFSLFSLATLRERHMDQHHKQQQEDIDKQKHHTPKDEQENARTNIEKHLNNGWIPNEDIERFYAHDDNNNNEADTEGSSSSSYKPYEPSLNNYPLTNLQNTTSPIQPTDVIFFWHIPKASGTSIKHMFTTCFRLNRPEMKLVPESLDFIPNDNNKKNKKNDPMNLDGVINVDISTIPGISRAKQEFQLVPSNTVDVIVSTYLHEGSALFTSEYRGRLFTMMRHPVEVVASLFSYLSVATWERNYTPELKNMTLLEYSNLDNNNNDGSSRGSVRRVDNWMTRYLARKLDGPLEEEHLKLAKEILEVKCLIGLLDHFEETMERFELFFGLDHEEEEEVDEENVVDNEDGDDGERPSKKISQGMKCVHQQSSKGSKRNVNKNRIVVEPGSEEWNAVANNNRFDVELYEFAKGLWIKQGKELFGEEGIVTKKDDDGSDEKREWNYRRKNYDKEGS